MALHKKCNQKREKSFYCIFMRAPNREHCKKCWKTRSLLLKCHSTTIEYTTKSKFYILKIQSIVF